MSTASYLVAATNEHYSSAWAFIGSDFQKSAILDVAQLLGVSAGAIAGAMAEENHAYANSKFLNDSLDKYALSGVSPVQFAVDVATLGLPVTLGKHAVEYQLSTRTHAEFAADYAVAGGMADEPYSDVEKVLHPVLVDMGPANIKLATAIRLINKYVSESQTLGLDVYATDYAALARDLVSPLSDVTAKIAGLMIKEADQWFVSRDHQAYGDQWFNLPQEFKDALYVTYFNFGPKLLQKKYDDFVQANPGKTYEPLPAMGTGGGMNHLLNIRQIGAAIGDASYGDGTLTITDNFLSEAKENSASGQAYRYALSKLRWVALPGLDYSAHNAHGELDLYDPATGTGNLTDPYLQDRAAFLTWANQANIQDKTKLTGPNAPDNWQFTDQAKSYTLDVAGWVLGQESQNPYHKVIFDGDSAGWVEGGTEADHLYGGGGDDIVKGNGGNDYLEGGQGFDELQGGADNDILLGGEGADYLTGGTGNDRLEGGAGNDTYIFNTSDGQGNDILLDADGQGKIQLDGQTLTGGDSKAPNRWEKNGVTYTYIPGATVNIGTLVITSSAGNLTLQNYTKGQLGLTLPEAAPSNPPGVTLTIVGDLKPADTDAGTAGIQQGQDDLGNVIVAAEAAANREDTLYDSSGSDS
ncbi:MAG: calcium-binding protein, partial [Sulfuricella sp.]